MRQETMKNKHIYLLCLITSLLSLNLSISVGHCEDLSSTIYSSETPWGMAFIEEGYTTIGAQEQDIAASSNAKPIHTVYLHSYYMDILEVTNQQYAECVAAGLCSEPEDLSSETRDEYYGSDWFGRFPVVNVTWQDAQNYCEYVGKRLPTEAEWEKAAMGSEDYRRYSWGSYEPKTYTINMTKVPGDTEMGNSYPNGASPYGLVDVVGNVSEWVADWYSETYYSESPDVDPTGPEEGTEKVIRGDSWKTDLEDVHVTNRYALDPDSYDNATGIRCAKDVRELVSYTITATPESEDSVTTAIVRSGQEQGVFILEEPGVGKMQLCTAKNGSVVEVLDGPFEVSYTQWYKIKTQNDCEGWTLASSLEIASEN